MLPPFVSGCSKKKKKFAIVSLIVSLEKLTRNQMLSFGLKGILHLPTILFVVSCIELSVSNRYQGIEQFFLVHFRYLLHEIP